jgi:abequosyltransferase
MTRPLLTISVPTYNRSSYLAILLKQLSKEIVALTQPDAVEVVVSDNSSSDDTAEVVQQAIEGGLHLRYLRNPENIGSDRNIAQAFNEAKGRYVLVMGDDDVLVDGALSTLLAKLINYSPSVVMLRAYGYEHDFRSELPKRGGGYSEFESAGEFLRKAGAQITLISACVIHKEIIEPLDAKTFVGGSLVQVHLVLRALLAGSKSIISNDYVVACKRNNSGGYIYAEVFVKNLGYILDYYSNFGLSLRDISNFENHLLRSHHPYYVWRGIGLDCGLKNLSKSYFDNRFKGRFYYLICVWPIFSLPKPLAWFWGLCSTGLGRVFFGDDLIRGLFFLKNKLM